MTWEQIQEWALLSVPPQVGEREGGREKEGSKGGGRGEEQEEGREGGRILVSTHFIPSNR